MARYSRLTILLTVTWALTAAPGCRSFRDSDFDAAPAPAPAAEPALPADTPAAARPGPEAPAPGVEDPFADALRRIEEARNQPVADGNYRVQVERIWFAESESAAFGALLGYVDDHVSVVAGGLSPDAGFRVGFASGGFFGALDGHLRSSRATTREQIMLAMMPDYPASLAIGRTRTVIPFTVGGVEFALLVPQGQFIGTSLEALCHDLGDDRVQVQLTPVFSGVGPHAETVRVAQATTTVVVPRGQPLLIASQDWTGASAATALLSRRTERGTEQAVLVLTVN